MSTSNTLEGHLAEEDEVLLDDLVVEQLEATPSRIGPFGASRLQWKVAGPLGGFIFELNRRRVPPVGDQLFTPDRTQTFELAARIRKSRRVLGRVTVQVDLSACDIATSSDIGRPIERFLREIVARDDELYFRQRFGPGGVPIADPGPIISFRTNEIRFELALRIHFQIGDWPAPDPSVDIKARFGLDVVNARIVPANPEVTARVTVPWWVWAIPGVVIAGPILLSNGEQRAQNGGLQMVQGIAGILNLFAMPEPERRLHSVSVEAIEPDLADLHMTFCPDVLLRRLATEELAPPFE